VTAAPRTVPAGRGGPAPARPRRLVCVCGVAHPGGAEIGLLRLLRRLDGWAITVTTPEPGPLSHAVLGEGWAWAQVPAGGLARRAGARAALSFPRMRRLARAADVVYLNGGVAGRLLPAAGAARTVLHVHDLVDRVPRHWRRADVVLADSQAVADRLEGLEAHVVGCPVELDPPDVAPPWEPGGEIVGFVGRLEPRKGPLDLARAAPRIRAARPDARVVLVGDDPFGADPAYTEAVRSAPGVEVHGWVEDAAGLMRHLDVLVLPSHAEPFGTVLAEAMAAGTPVVATRVGGLPEVVDDGVTGRLVAPGRPDELADAVVEVLGRRAEMGAAARERARRFGADAYAERVAALLAPAPASYRARPEA
jgi:glycosyltransferase involved in cell wall biosynthesis